MSPDDRLLSHWRTLLAAIAPGVAAATLLQGLLNASAAFVVADGSYVVRPGAHQTVSAIGVAMFWTLSLCAAMLVVRGALLDAPVRAAYALRMGVRRWLPTALALAGFVLALVLLLFAASLFTGAGPLAIVAVGAAVVLASGGIGALPLAVFDDRNPLRALVRAWELAVGRRWRLLGLTLAVFVPGSLIVWVQPRIGSVASDPVTGFALSLALMAATVCVIAVQAAVLTRWYLGLDGIDRRLGSVPRPDRWWIGVAALAATGLVLTGVVVANPLGVPVMRSGTVPEDAIVAAVARGEAVLPDGGRVSVEHNGTGQDVVVTVCRAERKCETKAHQDFERTGGVWPRTAALAVGGGLIVVAVLQETGADASFADLVLWHCASIACDSPQRTFVAQGLPLPDFMSDKLRLAVALDRSGRPQIAWGTGNGREVTVFRCGAPSCAQPAKSEAFPYSAAPWPSELAGLGFDAQDRLVTVLREVVPDQPASSGLQIHIADPPRPEPELATITCRDIECSDPAVQSWHVADVDWHSDLRPVVLTDGSPALVDRAGLGGNARLTRCVSRCG